MKKKQTSQPIKKEPVKVNKEVQKQAQPKIATMKVEAKTKVEQKVEGQKVENKKVEVSSKPKIQIQKIQKVAPKPKIQKNISKGTNIEKMQKKQMVKQNNLQKPKPRIQLLKPVQENKKIVAVIISMMEGGSYDALFTSVEQKAEEGTQVLVYSCSSNASQHIVEAFANEQKADEILKQMLTHIKSVDPDCVVFNWECCSYYGSKKFPEGKDHVFNLVKIIIEKGYMAMFSDFSLKALIAQWNQAVLGPNPFVAVSQFGGHFTLHFNCERLKQCPSAQLQIVGDMATQGHCNVEAMGATIIFGVDDKKADNQFYKLQVLTVATSLNKNLKYQSQIGQHKGNAGHVVLSYKSGANVLVSMGHWIELMKIDTSEKVLFEVAERQFGGERAKAMKMEYQSLGQAQKKAYISKNAVQFVQSQAPCKNMSKKAKKMY